MKLKLVRMLHDTICAKICFIERSVLYISLSRDIMKYSGVDPRPPPPSILFRPQLLISKILAIHKTVE